MGRVSPKQQKTEQHRLPQAVLFCFTHCPPPKWRVPVSQPGWAALRQKKNGGKRPAGTVLMGAKHLLWKYKLYK